jgi:hypothetical protein
MNVGMMQPTFLPWLGFFELIHKTDVFIFLDDFQFSVQSYHQRNRLFINQEQIGWYTVPINKSSSFQMPLNKTKISEDMHWRIKLWKRIQQNYTKAKYFNHYEETLKNWFLSPFQDLAEQNVAFIKIVCGILKLEKAFLKSSEHPSRKQRSERVLELLAWTKANRYYCARGSFDYMLQDHIFPVEDSEVLFQNFVPRPYYQIGSPEVFVPYLSVLDALFNVGATKTLELIKGGTAEWHNREKMIMIKNNSSGEAR